MWPRTFFKGLFLKPRTFSKGLFMDLRTFFKGLSAAKIRQIGEKAKKNGEKTARLGKIVTLSALIAEVCKSRVWLSPCAPMVSATSLRALAGNAIYAVSTE